MANKQSMQVLSLGMSRTGTASMKEALRILGHKRVHHAFELYTYPEQSDIWLAAWNAKVAGKPFNRQQWDNLLEGYTAVTDMPAVCFAEELIEVYSEAKVILVVREEQAWLKSFTAEVTDTYFDNAPVTGIISKLDHVLMRPLHGLWTRLFATKDGFFRATTREEMVENSLGIYHEHNARVIATASSDRLLRYSLKDGWKPLCDFLGEPVPDVPFPRLNEGDAIKDVVGAFVSKSMKRAGLNLSLGIGLLAAAAYPLYSLVVNRLS